MKPFTQGNTEGRELVVETLFGRRARATPLSSRQWELMIGSLLGDATLLKTTAGYCFRVHHGLKQQPLVDWKYGELADYVRSPPRRSGNGYYFRTITHPRLAELRESFYAGQRKIVPIKVLASDLTEFGLALWIMDDGAADGDQLRLNTQSLSAEAAEQLAGLIRAKFGIVMTVNQDKGRPRFRCKAISMERLVSLVRHHTISEYAIQALPVTTSRLPREMDVLRASANLSRP